MRKYAIQKPFRNNKGRRRDRRNPQQCRVHGLEGIQSKAWATALTRAYHDQAKMRARLGLPEDIAVYSRSGKTVCARIEKGEWRLYRSEWPNGGLPPLLRLQAAVELTRLGKGVDMLSAYERAFDLFRLAYSACTGDALPKRELTKIGRRHIKAA